MGRPTKFSSTENLRIAALYGSGRTDRQVAAIMEISPRTLETWKVQFPDFLQSLKEGKDVADQMVEASLFHRAIGYSVEEKKVFCTKEGEIVEADTIRHYPPDSTAAIFWLKNRKRDKWCDQPAPEVETPILVVAHKKSFTEFIETAGYPAPFEKQIEMMNFGILGEGTRMILGARNYGKTDYVVILGLAYKLYLDPLTTALIMTKSRERNAAILSEIQNACEKNGMTFDKANQHYIRTTQCVGKDHSVSAVTVKSTSLRGRHPDLTVMDDPVTEDDTQDATRKNVEKKYNELHKLTPNILVLGQPAHKHDLYAKLRKLVKVLEVPHGTIPQLDHDLEAQRAAGVDESSISASYHLKILAEGATPFDNIKYLDQFPTSASVAWIDPAQEGKDHTALTIATAYGQGIAVVGFQWRKSWNHALDDIAPLMKRFNVKRGAFETNGLGDQAIDVLSTTIPGVGWIGRKSVREKHSKIMAAGTFAHMIHLAKESSKSYIDHVVQYEYGAKFDDAPDSLASCLEWLGLIRGKA